MIIACVPACERLDRARQRAAERAEASRRARRDGSLATQSSMLAVGHAPGGAATAQSQPDGGDTAGHGAAALAGSPVWGGGAGPGRGGGRAADARRRQVWAMSPRELTAALRDAKSVPALARLLQPLLLEQQGQAVLVPSPAPLPVPQHAQHEAPAAQPPPSLPGAPGHVPRPVVPGQVNLAGRAAHEALRRAGGLGVRGLTAALNQLAWLTLRGPPGREAGEPLGSRSSEEGMEQLSRRLHACLCGQLEAVGPKLDVRGATSLVWLLGKLRALSPPSAAAWAALSTRLLAPCHGPGLGASSRRAPGGPPACLLEAAAPQQLLEVALGAAWLGRGCVMRAACSTRVTFCAALLDPGGHAPLLSCARARRPLPLWQAAWRRAVRLADEGEYGGSAQAARLLEPTLWGLSEGVTQQHRWGLGSSGAADATAAEEGGHPLAAAPITRWLPPPPDLDILGAAVLGALPLMPPQVRA